MNAIEGGVTLRRLSDADRAAYSTIALPPEQETFGGRPEAAFDDLPDHMDLYGIETVDGAAGVFRIDRGYGAYDFAAQGEVGLRYFIVDHRQQGRGIAAATLGQLPDMLRRNYPDAPSIALTVNCLNLGAYRVYERAGFKDTGALYLGGGAGPQHVMRMGL